MGNLFSTQKSAKFELENINNEKEYVYSNQMTNQSIHIQEYNSERYEINEKLEIQNYLNKYGYVIIKNVLNKEEINKAIELIWEFLIEKCEMLPNDPSTWTDENFSKIGDSRTGILGFSGINQSNFLWYLRLIPNVKHVFQQVFDTDDLLTSFDGGNIFRPWHNPNLSQYHAKTSQGWFHVDQGRKLLGFHCVQGLVSLTDCNENTGGFCVIPGSHHQHTELMKSAATNSQNFVMVPADSPILASQQILPVCYAGDMILWDSRTVHCNTPALVESPNTPVDQLLRIVGYICMTPTSFIDRNGDNELSRQEVLETRVRLYERNIGTSHWPHLITTSLSKNSGIPKAKDFFEESEEKKCIIAGNEWSKVIINENLNDSK